MTENNKIVTTAEELKEDAKLITDELKDVAGGLDSSTTKSDGFSVDVETHNEKRLK